MNRPSLPDPSQSHAESPFSRMATWILSSGAILSLVTGFLLLVFRKDEAREVSIGSDSYSVSALGHHLLEQLLRATGRPVSVHNTPNTVAKQQHLLVLAEPDDSDIDKLRTIVRNADQVLVVLPKRIGTRDTMAEHWIGDASLCKLKVVENVLEEISTASVSRPDEPPERWQFSGLMPELPTPEIQDLQLLQGYGFRPLIRCRQGTLLAELSGDDQTIYVLSDPDLIANHGIGDGNNATFALEMLDALRNRRSIVLDETIHGFEKSLSLWEELGRFPLVLLLVHVFLLIAIVGWFAASHFGPILARPRQLANDKQFLIENTASLMMRSNHTNLAIRRYFRDRTRFTAQRLGLSGNSDEALLAALIKRAEHQRNEDFAALHTTVEHLKRSDHQIHPQEATQLARRIRAAFEELVHGSH